MADRGDVARPTGIVTGQRGLNCYGDSTRPQTPHKGPRATVGRNRPTVAGRRDAKISVPPSVPLLWGESGQT